MIKLKDLITEAHSYNRAKVRLYSGEKDAEVNTDLVEFTFIYTGKDPLGKGPGMSCIPKTSKDLDKIDRMGSISKNDITKQLAEFVSKKTKQKFIPIDYRHFDQYTIALDLEPIFKKIK